MRVTKVVSSTIVTGNTSAKYSSWRGKISPEAVQNTAYAASVVSRKTII
jgi:hypothetical protein